MTDASLNASFWLMIILQTMGSLDLPGWGPRKMPAPRAYVAIIVAWSVLQVAADAGFQKGAAKFGWLMVLAGMVLGPFGKRLVKLFTWISATYGGSTVTGGSSGNTFPGDTSNNTW